MNRVSTRNPNPSSCLGCSDSFDDPWCHCQAIHTHNPLGDDSVGRRLETPAPIDVVRVHHAPCDAGNDVDWFSFWSSVFIVGISRLISPIKTSLPLHSWGTNETKKEEEILRMLDYLSLGYFWYHFSSNSRFWLQASLHFGCFRCWILNLVPTHIVL